MLQQQALSCHVILFTRLSPARQPQHRPPRPLPAPAGSAAATRGSSCTAACARAGSPSRRPTPHSASTKTSWGSGSVSSLSHDVNSPKQHSRSSTARKHKEDEGKEPVGVRHTAPPPSRAAPVRWAGPPAPLRSQPRSPPTAHPQQRPEAQSQTHLASLRGSPEHFLRCLLQKRQR